MTKYAWSLQNIFQQKVPSYENKIKKIPDSCTIKQVQKNMCSFCKDLLSLSRFLQQYFSKVFMHSSIVFQVYIRRKNLFNEYP